MKKQVTLSVRQKTLGIINIALALFLGILLIISLSNAHLVPTFSDFIKTYASFLLVVGLPFFLNSILAYKLLKEKENEKQFSFYIALTLSSPFWFLLYFFGYHYAPSVYFPIISILFAVAIFFLINKHSQKTALFLSLTTLVVAILAIFSGFESEYCWRVASASPIKDTWVKPNENEKRFMSDSNDPSYSPDASISGWLRVKLQCHKDFNFQSAIKEKYFNVKQPSTDEKSSKQSIYTGDHEVFQTDISEKPRGRTIAYVVEENDTLASIARKFSISKNTIRWENNLTNDTLVKGQTLWILPVTGIAHKVVEGDAVQSLAKKYQTDAQKIVDFPFNDFVNPETYALLPGQILFIPDGKK